MNNANKNNAKKTNTKMNAKMNDRLNTGTNAKMNANVNAQNMGIDKFDNFFSIKNQDVEQSKRENPPSNNQPNDQPNNHLNVINNSQNSIENSCDWSACSEKQKVMYDEMSKLEESFRSPEILELEYQLKHKNLSMYERNKIERILNKKEDQIIDKIKKAKYDSALFHEYMDCRLRSCYSKVFGKVLDDAKKFKANNRIHINEESNGLYNELLVKRYDLIQDIKKNGLSLEKYKSFTIMQDQIQSLWYKAYMDNLNLKKTYTDAKLQLMDVALGVEDCRKMFFEFIHAHPLNDITKVIDGVTFGEDDIQKDFNTIGHLSNSLGDKGKKLISCFFKNKKFSELFVVLVFQSMRLVETIVSKMKLFINIYENNSQKDEISTALNEKRKNDLKELNNINTHFEKILKNFRHDIKDSDKVSAYLLYSKKQLKMNTILTDFVKSMKTSKEVKR